jgi:hypothetical protein
MLHTRTRREDANSNSANRTPRTAFSTSVISAKRGALRPSPALARGARRLNYTRYVRPQAIAAYASQWFEQAMLTGPLQT